MPTSSSAQQPAVEEDVQGKAGAPAHTHADGSHEEHPMPMIRMIPARHTKVVHFIRHGEGFHNVAGHANPEEYKSFEYLDAHLTDFGWRQARALGKHIRALGPAFRADAIIVSPLTRTLETAAGVFGAGPWQSGDPQPPLMQEQTAVPGKRSEQHAISAAGCPPFIAWEGCREHLGQHPCDKRRPTRELAHAFPAVDFSLIESDEDVLWQLEHRETHDEIRRRGVQFVQWLMARPEAHLAVLAHGGFLHHMLSQYRGHLAGGAMMELQRWRAPCLAHLLLWNLTRHSLLLLPTRTTHHSPPTQVAHPPLPPTYRRYRPPTNATVHLLPPPPTPHPPTTSRLHGLVQWLMGRSERELAVVGHSSMLFFMSSAFGHSAAPAVQGELHKWYENCEMRTVVLADEGGAYGHPCRTHFHGGHAVKTADT